MSKRKRNVPGKFIPEQEVRELLVKPVYCVQDLVDLGLFNSRHYVIEAVIAGHLKGQKLNKNSLVICRDDLLHYWCTYRLRELELTCMPLKVDITPTEAGFLSALVGHVATSIHDYSFQDLIRNFIQRLMKCEDLKSEFAYLKSKAY